MTPKPSGTHRQSHRTLLRQERCGDGSVDAIVMPASRPAANLLPAMEVASALGLPGLREPGAEPRRDLRA